MSRSMLPFAPPVLFASVVVLASGVLLAGASADETRPADVLVRVDGETITRADLEFEFATAGVPGDRRADPALRRKYLESLVDARLLARFLRSRKATADREAVDEQVQRIRRLFERRGLDPDAVLRDVGYTPETLREKLALPIAWEQYARQVVRPADVQAYWEKHRRRFDGTRIRARQILLVLPKGADPAAIEEARTKLAEVRRQVLAGSLDFAAAARDRSQSPSASEGGDVGWFSYRGKMPVSFTEPVFALENLEPAAMTEPFPSPFGMHLVQISEVEPGTYSLEDVREAVFDALADQVRSDLIEKARETAEVEWVD